MRALITHPAPPLKWAPELDPVLSSRAHVRVRARDDSLPSSPLTLCLPMSFERGDGTIREEGGQVMLVS